MENFSIVLQQQRFFVKEWWWGEEEKEEWRTNKKKNEWNEEKKPEMKGRGSEKSHNIDDKKKLKSMNQNLGNDGAIVLWTSQRATTGELHRRKSFNEWNPKRGDGGNEMKTKQQLSIVQSKSHQP